MHSKVLTDEFFASLDSSVETMDKAETLPPACYTDAAFYEFEKEAVFNHEWLCIGRESWVQKPGDYFTSSIIGEPLLVTRTREGEIRVMSAVCQHRGMLVAEGRGNVRGFVCPYHHWTYGLDGSLVNAPAMGKTCNFDKSEHGLPGIRSEVWQGFLFINFDNESPPLAPRLRALDNALEHYALADAEDRPPQEPGKYGWNWKVMFENNNDGYHANKLHQGPLHDFVPSSLARFPDLPDDTAGYFRWNGTRHPDASFNVTQRALLTIFPGLTEEDRGQMIFANIPPTLSLVLTADMVIYLILRADGPESLEMDTGLLLASGATADPAFRHKMAVNMAGAEEIMAQDWHVDELVQVGLRSRFAPRGRYSWQEGAQHEFNKWLVPRYRSCWNRMRNRTAS